jgi:hypothetical protein
VEGSRRTIAAGVGALTGEAAVVEAYRDAMRIWRELELFFPLALCQLDFVTLAGGDEPDAAAAAAEARQIFERLRARPFLARLDRAMAAGRERVTRGTPAGAEVATPR